jgi:hypothetical protein
LTALGADIHVPTYSKRFDGTPDRACELKRYILCLLSDPDYLRAWHARYPGEPIKVNIIGHSQGCQDARYMISNLGMGDLVASWTGLAGQAQGSPLADMALQRCGWIIPRDLKESLISLSMEYMACEWCAEDVEGVYYQSWSAIVMHPHWRWFDDRPLWRLLLRMGYENDMWMPTCTQIYGNHRGTLVGDGYHGVHHMAFLGPDHQPNPGFDAYGFWAYVLSDLKARGF